MTDEGMAETNNDGEFLGRAFVPITLGVFAACIVTFAAFNLFGEAYISGTSIVAMALTLRFTWDRRAHHLYTPIISILILMHIGVIYFFAGSVERAPGAVFMLFALMEAIGLTCMIRKLM